MKAVALFVLVLACAASAAAPKAREEIFPVLIIGTNLYQNAKITRTTASEAFIKFDGGMIRAKLNSLPREIQEKYPPSATPDLPAGGRPRRPPVFQRVPLEVALTNLETQVAILERAKENLQISPPEQDPANPSSGPEMRNVLDQQRRILEIDRNLSRLRVELEQLREIKEKAAARLAAATNSNWNASTNLPPPAPSTLESNRPAPSNFPPFGPKRPLYRNGSPFPRPGRFY